MENTNNEFYNNEIEKAVLYYIIFEKKKNNLKKDYFYFGINRQIFDIIQILEKNNKEISILTIQANSNEPDTILKYLCSLGDNIYGTTFETVLFNLKEFYKKRKIYKLLNQDTKILFFNNTTEEIINNMILQLNIIKGE